MAEKYKCPACPGEVRDLMATAHNAYGAVSRAIKGNGSWDRAERKLAELGRSVERMQAIADWHFKNCPQETSSALGKHYMQVWCRTCHCGKVVDAGECLQSGWPKCCGYTMTLDHPSDV